ncbi:MULTISPECIES: hypothetical protein [unclassified Exiguobacterium]|nr:MULTISPECIES: hypothetical protein [unclassified Exiguobacterium]TCI66630.1 hypothetical protein EVJ19_14825 [Exiguobacterium sp. IPCI3]TCI75953.1 hypothetical protein EVJ18_14805 [Exiguobacterium sp. IPCH1]TCI76845.1 hypothetical protein EVJ17_14805 [Exiguobacterium sp. IPBC4]
MSISLLYKTETFTTMSDQGGLSLSEVLFEILEVINNSNLNIVEKKKSELIYLQNFAKDTALHEILFIPQSYQKFQISDDEHKMLLSLIEKSTTVTNDEYLILSKTLELKLISEPYAYLCLALDECKPLHVNSLETMLEAKRTILASSSNVNEFVSYLEYCFPNLKFSLNILATLKTLSSKFPMVVNEVIRHLEALNDTLYPMITEERNGSFNLPNLLERFGRRAGLECTLQGNPKYERENLQFDFRDGNGEKAIYICSPHTKITSTSTEGTGTYLYDRIYFHVGDINFCGGKILVGHIGKHL